MKHKFLSNQMSSISESQIVIEELPVKGDRLLLIILVMAPVNEILKTDKMTG